jgi:enoyl-CoA hydratase/carnithine racemase
MSDVVSVTDEEHLRIVTITRPDAMNAMNRAVLEELMAAFDGIEVGGDVRAAVITGEGEKAFCAGVDLTDMPLSPDQDLADYSEGLGLFQGAVRSIRTADVPVVAAVNGYALGAGCDLSLAADFRIAGENATFAETFVDVGFIPGDGGAYLLPRLIGEANARELIYSGRHVGPDEAVDLGMARESVDQEEVLDAAKEYARDLATGPTVAHHHAKQLVNESFEVDLETAFEHATVAQRQCSQTHDHEEAVEAFAEKRDPEFEGR